MERRLGEALIMFASADHANDSFQASISPEGFEDCKAARILVFCESNEGVHQETLL